MIKNTCTPSSNERLHGTAVFAFISFLFNVHWRRVSVLVNTSHREITPSSVKWNQAIFIHLYISQAQESRRLIRKSSLVRYEPQNC